MNNKKLASYMKQFQRGDVEGFNELYERTKKLVFYQVYRILKDYGLSEDLMQNVYITVYEKKVDFKGGSVLAWIQRIAKNQAINEYNRRKRIQLVEVDNLLDGINNENQKETPLIDLARDHLADDEFMILMLCVVEGYKRREVAKIMSLSTSGVTWKLNQALNKLKILVKRGEENE